MTTALRTVGVASIEPGPLLDEQVCTLVGIKGSPLYFVHAPERDGSWHVFEFRSEADRAIAEANARGFADWRFGSAVREVTKYPTVSAGDVGMGQVADALVARGAKVSVSNRAIGWRCHLIVNPGRARECQVDGEGGTRALAVCAAVLAAAEALRQ